MFIDMTPLSIGFIPIEYKGEMPFVLSPLEQCEYIREIYPLSEVNCFPLNHSLNTNSWLEGLLLGLSGEQIFRGGLLINRLNELDNLYEGEGWPLPYGRPDQIMGVVPHRTWADPQLIQPIIGYRLYDGQADAKFAGGNGRVFYVSDSYNWIAAHEMAHNLDRQHPGCAEARFKPDEAWPYGISYAIQDVGIKFGSSLSNFQFLEAETDDLMVSGYCGATVDQETEKWISSYTYLGLFNELRLPQTPSPIAKAETIAKNNQQETAVLLASGVVLAEGTAVFDATYQLNFTNPVEQNSGSNYCLVLENASQETLTQDCFDLSFNDSELGSQLNQAFFTRVLSNHSGAHRLVLKQGDSILAEQIVTPNSPVITLQNPVNDTSRSDPFELSWAATDADGDTLHYIVSYSADNGANWHILALNVTENHLTIDPNELPGSEQALFRVIATDGFNTVSDVSDFPITLPKHALPLYQSRKRWRPLQSKKVKSFN